MRAIQRLWSFFWQPSSRIGLGALLVLGGFGGIIFWGGFNTVMEQTNTMRFCISCHEMESTVYQEYKQTVHFKNASGVQATCSDCHVPKDWTAKVVRKIQATGELYHHFAGTIDTKEKFEAHRATMAKRVWASMEATDSRECRNCHEFSTMDFHAQRPESAKAMQPAMEKGETCITCHKGIAHKMPDLSSGYKKQFEELQMVSADVPGSADILYTVSEIPLFLDASEVGKGRGAGVLLSATEVQVVDRQKDALKVRVEGWRQEGADRIFYELMGQRIFTLTLAPGALEHVSVGDPKVDPNTDLIWLPVSVEAWVAAENLVESREKLWEYAEEMYTASCASCHGKSDPAHYLANQWIGTLKSMERFISLDKREYRLLLKYLQLHASDTKGHGDAH